MTNINFCLLATILFAGFAALMPNKKIGFCFLVLAALCMAAGLFFAYRERKRRRKIGSMVSDIKNMLDNAFDEMEEKEKEQISGVEVKFKKLDKTAQIPTKSHDSDAGFDLTSVSRERDDRGNLVFHTGLAVEIPEGYAGFLFPRSSIASRSLILTNCVGVIDSGYRGEILAKFKPLPYTIDPNDLACSVFENTLFNYESRERFLQMIVMPVPSVKFTEVEELSPSDRGEGGYGSTNK